MLGLGELNVVMKPETELRFPKPVALEVYR